jgi:hypothetical protein
MKSNGGRESHSRDDLGTVLATAKALGFSTEGFFSEGVELVCSSP